MNFELHYLDSHIDYIVMNLKHFSKGKRREVLSRYKGNGNLMSGSMECEYDGSLLVMIEES